MKIRASSEAGCGSCRALAATISRVACPCDNEIMEMTRWAVTEVGSYSQAPCDRLACFRRRSGLANRLKMTCSGHTGPSVSTWDPAMRADGSMKAAAGSVPSYSALISTGVTRAVTVK
jgi:hypothetical protein